jgi:hypothetical protein
MAYEVDYREVPGVNRNWIYALRCVLSTALCSFLYLKADLPDQETIFKKILAWYSRKYNGNAPYRATFIPGKVIQRARTMSISLSRLPKKTIFGLAAVGCASYIFYKHAPRFFF